MSRLKRETVAGGLVASLLALALATTGTFAQTKQEEPRYEAASAKELPKPILSTHDLMELFNEQVYIYLQEAMAKKPADAEGWTTIEERGLQAAEVMNLVAIREMADKHQAWLQLVSEAQHAALGLTEAAKTRDFDKTQAAYRTLIQSCNACHQKIAPDEAPQLEP